MKKEYKIAVIGLGYVGLPLAALFAAKYAVIGYDINKKRIQELQTATDSTQEVSQANLEKVLQQTNPLVSNSKGLYFSSSDKELAYANYYIITVPTPVDINNTPDLTPLKRASELVGGILKKGDVVVYESTVYPGVTEEECVPVLERKSGLQLNVDFFVGYSPERVNPGDKQRTIDKIIKVTSGSTPEIATEIDTLYNSVIPAGTHKAPSIKVAEAAKVIENSQRDINIAFMNELAKIFAAMNIDTQAVLKAAGTKWNFMPFQPGLVGGHCIGVDPFYLAQKAQQVGYYSELILTARRLNDSMGSFVASQVIKLMIKNDLKIKGSNILVMGVTFKENCPDMRNSKVWDVVDGLLDYGCNVSVYDPWVDWTKRKIKTGISVVRQLQKSNYNAAVLAVGHRQFLDLDLRSLLDHNAIIYDVKGVLQQQVDGKL